MVLLQWIFEMLCNKQNFEKLDDKRKYYPNNRMRERFCKVDNSNYSELFTVKKDKSMHGFAQINHLKIFGVGVLFQISIGATYDKMNLDKIS